MKNYKDFRKFVEKAPAAWSANKTIIEARKKGIKIKRQTALKIIKPHVEKVTRLEWRARKEYKPRQNRIQQYTSSYDISKTESRNYGFTRAEAKYFFSLLKQEYSDADFIRLKVNVYRIKNGRYYILHKWTYSYWSNF